jgi:hypothetical protein
MHTTIAAHLRSKLDHGVVSLPHTSCTHSLLSNMSVAAGMGADDPVPAPSHLHANCSPTAMDA